MWTHLEPHSAKLEQVFEPLHAKAAQYDHAWSIAELRLSEDDVTWLRSWFGCLTPESTENWTKSVMLAKYEDDACVTYRQMFGSLFICAGAEVCREESREDSVWPAIRSIFPESNALRHELFLSNGQPSPLIKDAIADAVRILNLRNAMDIEGAQQWFVTIKLQFGFTYRGAKNRLAEWLVSLGRPHAVHYLNGESEFSELASESFQSMWRALTQYRRGLIEETEARNTLQRNPWVKAHWIDDLLKEAKAKIATLGTRERHEEETETYEEEVSEEELCPIVGIALEWIPNTAPRFRFQLDRQAIEDEVVGADLGDFLDFCIDGRRLCRWLCQRDGSWAGVDHIYAEPNKYSEQPNLNPRTLVVQSSSGESLLEWDFADSGLSEDVLVFDLERERMVKAGLERLEPNRRYAIVCDRKCELRGSNTVETFERNGISRKAIRLALPLNENLSIVYEDFVLWQPVKAESDQLPRIPLSLTTPEGTTLSLHDRSKLFLEGLPEDAKSVKLLIYRKTYDVEQDDSRWRTLKDVTITPELAARQRWVRVYFSSGNRKYKEKPRLAFSLLGAAMLRHQQNDNAEKVSFEVLKQGDQLNCSEGTTYLRIWTLDHDKGASVFESDCQVGRLKYQKIRLRDIPGHGGELQVMSQGERHSLGIACLDTGCVRDYLPPLLSSSDAQLFLLSDKDPAEVGDNGFALYVWFVDKKGKARLRRLPDSSVQPSSSDRVWKIRDSCNPMAVALTWKGAWLGAWWGLERICDYVNERTDLPEHDFAIMKWLCVPVLQSTLSPSLAKAILQAPSRFIKTWLNDSGLPDGLKPHAHILGIDSVVRHFLWNDFPPGYAKDTIDIITQRDGGLHQIDSHIGYLQELSDISPVLLWKGMEKVLRLDCNTIRDLLRMFARAEVGLPSDADRQQMLFRLQGLEKRTSSATGISQERLKEIIYNCFRLMYEKRWRPLEEDRVDLLRLGQTISGRKYLSVRMGLYWLDLAKV